jgi:integration host factor subunit beta
MTWAELVAAVAARTGTSQSRIREILGVTVEIAAEALGDGESVSLQDLGRLDCRWRGPTIVRSVSDGRRMRVDGRWVPDFRPSSVLCERLEARTPQYWRDPEHQNAWRVAEALVGDVALYDPESAPEGIGAEDPDDQVHAKCAEAFGPSWTRARQGYDSRVSQAVRLCRDYLAIVARSRWARAEAPPADAPDAVPRRNEP